MLNLSVCLCIVISDVMAGDTVIDWLISQGKVRNRTEGTMLATGLLNEGYLQPAGELSKAAVEGSTESAFLDQPEALYYFVSEHALHALQSKYSLWMNNVE